MAEGAHADGHPWMGVAVAVAVVRSHLWVCSGPYGWGVLGFTVGFTSRGEVSRLWRHLIARRVAVATHVFVDHPSKHSLQTDAALVAPCTVCS